MQVGDTVSVGPYMGTITALASLGPVSLVQVALDLPFSSWFPAEIVVDPANPTPAPRTGWSGVSGQARAWPASEEAAPSPET